MADDGGLKMAWPIQQFRFEVDFGTELKGVAFQEVSGLEIESQIIEYRHGNSPVFSTVKMPGIAKYGHITMKKGVFASDSMFWSWYKEIKMNTITRRAVVIRLLDEGGKMTMQWALKNAWPTKVLSTDLKSDGNEVAVESIEFAHEGLTISNG